MWHCDYLDANKNNYIVDTSIALKKLETKRSAIDLKLRLISFGAYTDVFNKILCSLYMMLGELVIRSIFRALLFLFQMHPHIGSIMRYNIFLYPTFLSTFGK